MCVEFCLSNPQGMWLPAIPFFLYIIINCYGSFMLNDNNLFLLQTVKENLFKADIELQKLAPLCPVANYFIEKLNPLKNMISLL